jgi:hypothetical protein
MRSSAGKPWFYLQAGHCPWEAACRAVSHAPAQVSMLTRTWQAEAAHQRQCRHVGKAYRRSSWALLHCRTYPHENLVRAAQKKRAITHYTGNRFTLQHGTTAARLRTHA